MPVRRPVRDRRKVTRRVINRVARYHCDGALPRTCTVTDISDGGARLYAETDLPSVFVLEIEREGIRVRRDCEVVWRLGGECGVKFVDGRRG
jgi:hypothetical protein